MASVSIVGTGYVGLCTGVLLAELDHEVTLADLDPAKVDAVRQGTAPFHEPGLDEALKDQVAADRITATTDTPAAVRGSSITFLCVGTPTGEDGAADLSAIEAAARDVGEALGQSEAEHVVVTKSTVPPGTTEELVAPAVRDAAGLDPDGHRVQVAMNPEFLREGSALADARDPDKIVVGAETPRAIDRVAGLYAELDAPVVRVDAGTAETIKYANNALLATKVSFANEMANVCEETGADWRDVAEAVGLDDRLSGKFLRAGVGFGGSCFPKDVRAIRHVAQARGQPSRLLEAVLEVNETQPLRAVELLEDELDTLDGADIALLGLAFKPGTDDVRSTRAVPILDALEDRGASVVGHDPRARETFRQLRPDAELAPTVEAALDGADAAIVQTAWPSYREIDPDGFLERMRTPVVVDGRRALDAARFEDSRVRYRAIGRAPDR